MVARSPLLQVGDEVTDSKGRATFSLVEKWQQLVRPKVASVTQITSQTTGVTINGPAGQITLFSAAGSTTYKSFTVTNGVVTTNSVITVCQVSGSNLYRTQVSNIANGSFQITFASTSGTATEAPVFSFYVHRAGT